MEKGIFITLEGPEGGGKTEQFERIVEALRKKGHKVLAVRESGGTRIGEEIKEIILDHKNKGMLPLTEFFLLEGARAQIVQQSICPALKQGNIVLCDRFSDNAIAYQGYGRGLPLEKVEEVNILATDGLIPDLTILFDISVKEGIERRRGAEKFDRLDREEIKFHQRVRQGYLEMARQEPERWRIIDASRSKDEVWQDVWSAISSFLAGRSKEGRLLKGKEKIA